MKKFFLRDSVVSAIVAGVGVMAVFCFLLWLGLEMAGESISSHIRWFGAAFIPLVLVLRAYAKTKKHIVATRTLIVLFFVVFISYMYYLLSNHIITFK